MKIKLITIILAVTHLFAQNKQTNSTNIAKTEIIKKADIEKNIKMLQEFYIRYFSEIDRFDKDMSINLDSLIKKHLAKELVDKIDDLSQDNELGADPLINGQDISPIWRETLTIQYLPKDNLYEMCTKWTKEEHTKFCSYLSLKKINGEYKIYDIKFDYRGSVLNMSCEYCKPK